MTLNPQQRQVNEYTSIGSCTAASQTWAKRQYVALRKRHCPAAGIAGMSVIAQPNAGEPVHQDALNAADGSANWGQFTNKCIEYNFSRSTMLHNGLA